MEETNVVEKNPLEGLFESITGLLDEREALLKEREEMIVKELAKLQLYEKSLQAEKSAIDDNIAKKRKELEEELSTKAANLDIKEERIALEQQELDKRRAELQKYEQTVTEHMKDMLDRQLEEQRLKADRERLNKDMESFKLLQGSVDLGVDSGLMRQLQRENEELRNQLLELTSSSSTKIEATVEAIKTEEVPMNGVNEDNMLPEYVLGFERAAKKEFPKCYILEHSKDRLCLSVKERELRFFFTQQPRSAKILLSRKKVNHAKNALVQFNRMSSEWSFEYEDNFFVATMVFTAAIAADTVMKKCAEALKLYFE